MKPIKTVCIGGGGFVAYAYYGAVKYLKEHNVLDECTTYIGTSAGAIISLIMVLNTSDEIIDEMFCTSSNAYHEDDLDLYNFIDTWGICNKNRILKMFNAVMKNTYGNLLTFKELYEITGKKFVVCAVNVSKQKMTYFSHENFPDLNVIDAVEASMNIPFIMQKKVIDGDVYCDGCLGPSVGKVASTDSNNETLLIHHYKPMESSNEINTIWDYASNMIGFFNRTPIEFYDNHPTILIDSTDIPFVNFDCDDVCKNKENYMKIGEYTAEKWLNERNEIKE